MARAKGKKNASGTPVYSWRPGFPAKVNAALAAAMLQKLNDERGGVTPDDVLEEASPADHPVHPQFEWDNTVAGHEFRRIQVRTMVRALQITSEAATPARTVYVSVTDAEGETSRSRIYRPLVVVTADPDTTDLTSAIKHLTERLVAAEAAVQEVRSAAGDQGQGALAGILEALTTARTLAATLR